MAHAAARGVRVRVLIDDGETVAGDERITALEAHPSIEIRIYNPFAYRGHITALRAVEFLFNAARLDYRMHNKLLIVDNSIALVGGRNIGDVYFQIDPDKQFADDDVFAAGPIVQKLSGTFDEFWNSPLVIPAEALSGGKSTHAVLDAHREALRENTRQVKAAMNFDQRSMHLNTEIGLIIDSPVLAEQIAARFDAWCSGPTRIRQRTGAQQLAADQDESSLDPAARSRIVKDKRIGRAIHPLLRTLAGR